MSPHLGGDATLQTITDKIRSLPPELQREVEHFVDFLLTKTPKQEGKRFVKQDWAGGLAQFKNQYTALELQRKAMEWREG